MLGLHCCKGFLWLQCVVFSLRGLLLLQSMGSRVYGLRSFSSKALEHRLNSWGPRAQLLCGMCHLPRPGIEPMSPALAGGFFTTEPPGKLCFKKKRKKEKEKVYLFGLSCSVACGILVTQSGIRPGFSAFGAWSLSHWDTRKREVSLS